MLFARDVTVELAPTCLALGLPYAALLDRLRRVAFEARSSETILATAARADPLATARLHPAEAVHGGVAFDDAVLFPEVDGVRLTLGVGDAEAHAFDLEEDALPDVGELIRLGVGNGDLGALRDAAEDLGPELIAQLTAPRAVAQPRWSRPTTPGVFRREHATVLVRSTTTSLLVDPISLWRGARHAPLHDDPLDGIVITHGHADHFHPASILACAQPHTQVVVPEMPRRNLLSLTPFGPTLDALGLRVVAPPWDSTLTIGDIEIDVLPFFGEQPTRLAPGPAAGVRSWGNCYRFTTPQMSLVLLVDSGTDPMGGMAEVAERSRRQRGAPDLVLSCLRSFASPFFGGLPQYWATLPFDRLRALYREYLDGSLPATTSGVQDTAAVCAAFDARFFAPYAHGFAGVGAVITDVDWGEGGPSEATLAHQLAEAIDARGGRTQVVEWTPGDALTIGRRGMRLVRPGRWGRAVGGRSR